MNDLKIEETGKTLKTKNYCLFKTDKANRDTNEAKVKVLAKLMSLYGWLHGSFIVVDKNFVIINGQHRFLAAQIAGVEIHFIKLEVEATPELIRRNNLHHMSWSLEDTLKGFVADEHKDYIELSNFRQNHPELKFTDVMMIAKTSTRSAYRSELENGTFKMKDPELSEEWVRRIKSFSQYVPDYNSRSFVRSLTKLFVQPEFNFDEFMIQLKKYPYMIRNFKQIERNMEMFTTIYNKGRRKDRRVTFKTT